METSTSQLTHEELAIAREQGFLPKRETSRESYTRSEVKIVDLLDGLFAVDPSSEEFLGSLHETLTHYGYKENSSLRDMRKEILKLVATRSEPDLEATADMQRFQEHVLRYQESITELLHDPEGSDSLVVRLQTFFLLDELEWYDQAQEQLRECYDLANQLQVSYSHLF